MPECDITCLCIFHIVHPRGFCFSNCLERAGRVNKNNVRNLSANVGSGSLKVSETNIHAKIKEDSRHSLSKMLAKTSHNCNLISAVHMLIIYVVGTPLLWAKCAG